MIESYNIVTFGKKKENLDIAVSNLLIASYQNTFKNYIQKGSVVFLHCNSLVWGSATVASDYFYDETRLWRDKVYPHRFRIEQIQLLEEPFPISDGNINIQLKKIAGSAWAFSYIFSPKPLPKSVGESLLNKCRDSNA